MKLGLKLVSIRYPIGIFTWHEDDIAKRIGPHGENAFADIDRKTVRMRAAKLLFRLKKLVSGGCFRPFRTSYEMITLSKKVEKRSRIFPQLGL